MIQTIIIGKQSNLSNLLNRSINDSFLISSREIIKNIDILSQYKGKTINIIFNNFQPATQLNNIDSANEYITSAIVVTAKVLDYFKETQINKIIYTSSSSVYGNNILCNETDQLNPMNLHASLKVANEKLIEKYCSDNDIDYTIARIFNMYGGNDKFSIISKLIGTQLDKKNITIVNNGNAIRDFIHIDDVVNIYKKILNRKVNILNIGTGQGISVKSLLDFLHNRGIELQVNNIIRDELKISTADNKLLTQIIGEYDFKSVEEYLINELHI